MKDTNKKAVCIMSGGMDSTLAAYMMKNQGYEIVAVHFNYDQRTEAKELECFESICKNLNVTEQYILDLDFFKQLGASALTDKSIEVVCFSLWQLQSLKKRVQKL